MKKQKGLGYIFQTGAATADKSQFQQLVTIDSPVLGKVVDSCLGRQGPYFLALTNNYYPDDNSAEIYVLPQPGGTTDVSYEGSRKQEYIWKSKKFVMPGRTTFGAMKVVHAKGCVRVKICVDCRCVYEAVVQGCAPFRLPSQIAGTVVEIELRGTATVYEVHIASTMKELTRVNNG